MQDEPASDCAPVEKNLSPEAGRQSMESRNEEIVSSSPSVKKVDLSLQIPPKPVDFGKSPSGKANLQPQHSLKKSSIPGDISYGEGSSLLTPDTKEVLQSPILTSIISAFSWKRCSSLPVAQSAIMSPSGATSTKETSVEHQISQKKTAPSKVSRSFSVPARNVVIVRSVSFDAHKEPVQVPSDDQVCPMKDGDEEIPEDEAVCRICLVSLCEGGKTFKMECSCKGDLTLTHEECVVKWFSIKGNKKCDVCGNEVCNLPVNLLRLRSTTQRDHRHERNRQAFVPSSISAWHDFVVLILISSISYFFILEQLLVSEMNQKKNSALAIAAPFSFILGISGSTLAIVVAMKEYIWTYAALEFSLVSLIVHLFYVGLGMEAVYAITLAGILGFGVSLSINILYLYIRPQGSQGSHRETNSGEV